MRPVLMIALAFALTGAAAGPAGAHAFLVEASPKVGGRVAASPTELRLSFDEDLTPRQSSAVLSDAAGHVVATGAARLDAKDASVMIVPLIARLAPGRYLVRWRAVSPDHHVNTGDYGFSVGP